ncbi:hypothetical protein [Stackebrandtia soli]|uniref:hypothetical protein n=1 Tax=Stackebrandtia soli TaxID=1892856 RepID=UPI0039ED0928
MKKRMLISALLAGFMAAFVVVGGPTAAQADVSAQYTQYTATVTSSTAYFRYCGYDSCDVHYTRKKGEKDVLACQYTNSKGNVWFQTEIKALYGGRLHVYSGHFSSAYKNFLDKC